MNCKLFDRAVFALTAATFAVPLVVVPSAFIFPFIVPKILLFRSLTLLMVGAYALLLAANWHRYSIRLTPLSAAVGLFFVSFSISTFVGVDWYRSFWDNHERMLGLFTIFHFVLYYFVVTSTFREWKDWKWLLRMFVLAGAIVCVIGLLQKINPNLLLNRGADRVSATLGNAIYLGGYGMFLFFVSMFMVLTEESRIWKILIGLGGLLGLFGVFASGTRGTFVGLCAGLVAICAGYSLLIKNYRSARMIGLAVIVAGFGLLGLMYYYRATPVVGNIPVVGRLLNTNLHSGSSGTRIMAWGIAIDAWKEKPLFGWGPNNFYFAFNKYYRPQFLEYGWGETWFDNAHNIIVNTLAVQGIVGLLLYLAIFVIAGIQIFMAERRGQLSMHIAVIGAAYLVAHLVENIFVFENPTSYLYFFFILAFFNCQSKKPMDLLETRVKEVSIGGAVVTACVVALFIYSTDINPARANTAMLRAIQASYSQPSVSDYINSYQLATAIPTPHIDDIRADFARTAGERINYYLQNSSINKSSPSSAVAVENTEQAKKLTATALMELEKVRLLHPFDIRTHLLAADLMNRQAQILNDGSWLQREEMLLNEALSYSPRRQQIHFVLAGVKLMLGKNDEAFALLKQAIDNDPAISEGWWRLALSYQQVGNKDLAKKTAEDGMKAAKNMDDYSKQVLKKIIEGK